MTEESILLGFQVKKHGGESLTFFNSLFGTRYFSQTLNTNLSKSSCFKSMCSLRNLEAPKSFEFENRRQSQMYPKVRVRVHEQENHIPPQNDHCRAPVTKVSDESLTMPVKEIQGCSLPLKPRIMKTYVPKVPAVLGQSLSSTKVDKTRHLSKQDAKPDVRACSSLPPRPRAVLSSPDNDGMIGLVNKLSDKTPTAVKVHNTREMVRASQRQQSKTSPSPMCMTRGSNRAVFDKTGFMQRKLQKNMIGNQQQSSVGIGKSSFTT